MILNEIFDLYMKNINEYTFNVKKTISYNITYNI